MNKVLSALKDKRLITLLAVTAATIISVAVIKNGKKTIDVEVEN